MRRRGALVAAYAGLAAGGAALVVGLHRANPRFLVSAHGLLHAAVVERFWVDGWRVPPENPFFAGEPLPYYWTFHALAAAVGGPLGLDPLRSLELWIVAAWIVVVGACAALAPRLYGRAGLGLLAAWLVLAGANLQAPAVAAWRLARVGPSLLEDRGTYLWGLAHPMLGTMRLWDGGALFGPLVSFFLNVTSRPVALAGLVATVAVLARVLRRPDPARTALLVAATAFATAMSVVVGVPAALALGGGLVLAAARRRRGGEPSPWPGLAPALAGLALGAVLGFLPALHLAGGGIAFFGGGLGRAAEKLGAMAAAAWPVVLLAGIGWHRLEGARRAFVEALGLAALALVAGTLVLSLPVGNEVNLYHGALVLGALAAPAAFATGEPRRARRAAWLTALAFVPTFAMVVGAYAVRPSLPFRTDGRSLVRTDAPAAHAYAWIARETPRDAVVLIDPGPPPLALAGNTTEVPALTRRTLWTERPSHYVVEAHAEAAARAELARRVVSGAPLGAGDRARLRALGRPLFLLVDPRVAAPARSVIDLRHGPPGFAEGGWAVYPLGVGASDGAPVTPAEAGR